ncbi:MAG: methylmalonyl Co-A mutase-associated GTPase MeaB [Deltaproteobacteria bacterium]|nr:methylmalonyl Co-A mutase-associated GTPase MeaB [Deltaproteobacteria bacterium]
MSSSPDLVQEVLAGSVRAMAKLITVVENELPGAREAMEQLYPRTGKAYVIGLTGPPGSGKSTLTDKITQGLRRGGHTVGIVAVDPTSPFTGGALLGDRLRMQEAAGDEGVFVRSMATRGAMGGLARATGEAVKILDAFGKDFILIETVGVGQDEVDIIRMADTTLLVSVPGLGDDIQALKAGIMEIGDLFIVNKADREGAERLIAELTLMLDLNPTREAWRPPILKTVATLGEGVPAVVEKIFEHRRFLEEGNGLWKKRRERTRQEVVRLIEQEISRQVHRKLTYEANFEEVVGQIMARKKDPYSYTREVTAKLVLSASDWKD